MEPFPTVTNLVADPNSTGAGHLWLVEAVEGTPLRFQLQADGRLVFADRDRTRERMDFPSAVRPALTTIEREFERDALRDAVEDVDSLTFFGIATHQQRIDYDWEAVPAFVGVDVFSTERGGLLAPDAVDQSFERLGLTAAPALAREKRADAFKPSRYDFPQSTWADSSVAGVRAADKHGWRGYLENESLDESTRPTFEDERDAAQRLVTPEIRAAATGDDPVQAVRDEVARRHAADLDAAGIEPSSRSFRSAIAEVVTRADE